MDWGRGGVTLAGGMKGLPGDLSGPEGMANFLGSPKERGFRGVPSFTSVPQGSG